VGIARGRSHASLLVIPQRKKSLCEALHGRAAMARVGAPWPAMGVLLGEGREEEEEGEGVGQLGGSPWGQLEGRRAAARWRWAAPLYVVPYCAWGRKQEEGEEKRREEKRKEEGKKEKKRKEFFSKHGNFWKK
jgi:hypothetical protein